MKQIVKVFLFLVFVLMFSSPILSENPTQTQEHTPQESDLNWKCDPHYLKEGEIEIVVEKLREEEPNHKAICVSWRRQNSILWRTVDHDEIMIILKPIGDADKNPFYVTTEELKSKSRLTSTGLPRKNLTGVHRYKIKIKLFREGKEVHEIDPHTAVHGTY